VPDLILDGTLCVSGSQTSQTDITTAGVATPGLFLTAPTATVSNLTASGTDSAIDIIALGIDSAINITASGQSSAVNITSIGVGADIVQTVEGPDNEIQLTALGDSTVIRLKADGANSSISLEAAGTGSNIAIAGIGSGNNVNIGGNALGGNTIITANGPSLIRLEAGSSTDVTSMIFSLAASAIARWQGGTGSTILTVIPIVLEDQASIEAQDSVSSMGLPQRTNTEKDAETVGGGTGGRLLFNTTSGTLNYHDATSWREVGDSLIVEESDGFPAASGVNKIVVSAGALTNDGGGQVTINTGGVWQAAGSITLDSNAQNVSVSGIAAFDYLQVYIDLEIDEASADTSEEIQMTFNDDGGSNYSYRIGGSAASGATFCKIEDGGLTTDVFHHFVFSLFNKATALKTYQGTGNVAIETTNSPGSQSQHVLTGGWNNTSDRIEVITLEISPVAANIKTGSRVVVLGMNFPS